jgi:hypothetical protein
MPQEETDMNTTNRGNMLMAFAVGGLMGAVAALLLAPGPGSETRHRLREAGNRTTDRTRGAWRRARRAAAEGAHRVGNALEEDPSIPAPQAGHRPPWVDEGEVAADEPGAA